MKKRDYRHYFFLMILSIFSSLSYAKKILLTGGAGFIGSHVAQKLLERGDTVIIIDNLNDAYDIKIKRYNLSKIAIFDNAHRLSFYKIDICESDLVEEICRQEQPDVICHLAARAGVRASIDNPLECFQTNNNGTLSIFEAARKCGIMHVVMASSSSVYGVRQTGPFHETDSVDKQSSPYGMTKRAGELLAYVYYHLFNISSNNLRFFTVYGPRARMDMAPFIFMDAMYHHTPITVYGDGSAIRDFTYIDDIVQGIIKSIDTPMGYQIFNIGRGEPIVLQDFIKIMEEVVHREANVQYVSHFLGDVPQTHASIQKAQDILEYVPHISVRSGLEQMFEWYQKEYLAMIEYKRSPLCEVYIDENY
jgi:UDP-glucuronate 4-epimerase